MENKTIQSSNEKFDFEEFKENKIVFLIATIFLLFVKMGGCFSDNCFCFFIYFCMRTKKFSINMGFSYFYSWVSFFFCIANDIYKYFNIYKK